MPRKPIDYTNTHFYKICSKDLDTPHVYVGHTTDFRKRKDTHRRCCGGSGSQYPLYQFIREHGGWDNFDMILLETTSCNNVLEARRRERELIEQLGATLNKHLPSRTKQEYNSDHKDQQREYMKEYYQRNKSTFAAKHREYYQTHSDELKTYAEQYRQSHQEEIKQSFKAYYDQNKATHLERNKQYYEDNKDQLNAKRNVKFTCGVCGCTCSLRNRAKHLQSIRHQAGVESQSSSSDA
jgi:hypothetical protein